MPLMDVLRRDALDRFPNYGSDGCRCGPQATPAIDCPVHHAIVEFERMDDLLRGAVEALEQIRDWPMPTGNSSAAGVIERMQLLARQTLGGQYEASPASPRKEQP